MSLKKDAKARLLASGARIVPARAWIRGQLAGSRAIERYLRAGTTAGFDLGAFNEFAPAHLYPDELGVALEAHSAPFDLFGFDFRGGQGFPGERRRLAVTVTRDGGRHGVLQWIRLELCEGIEIENAPGTPAGGVGTGHWKSGCCTHSPSPWRSRPGRRWRSWSRTIAGTS